VWPVKILHRLGERFQLHSSKGSKRSCSLYDENHACSLDGDSYLVLVIEIDHTIQQDGMELIGDTLPTC
jgi:hypothetical protein